MIKGEEDFFSKTWGSITSLTSSIFRSKLAEKTTNQIRYLAKVRHLARSSAIGFGAGSIINVYASYREYKHAQEELRMTYAPEIATMLGKNPKDVTLKDLDTAAKINPTIAEAVKRNRKNRNLNFGINSISLVVSIAASAAALSVLGLASVPFFSILGLKALGVAGVVGIGVFLGVDKPLEIAGKKLLGLSEPGIHDVVKNPRLQRKLSLPGQIEYLENLQSRKKPISQEQVLTTFIAADPTLAAHIKSSYGKSFAALPDAVRAQVIRDIGPNYCVESITEDLNAHRIRAQELAFTVYGQQSGMPAPAAPRAFAPVVTAVEPAPSYDYRTRILEERQRNRQQSPAIT